MDIKKFLSADEVAAEFGLDASSLQKLVDAGEVQALADRGTWKYRRDELQSLVDAGKLNVRIQDPDDVSYIELDEEALAEQATMIKKSDSDSDVKLASDSDSDVQLAPEYHAPKAEDSGIVLDFPVDAGATVASSGSSLRLPKSVPGAVEGDSAIHLGGDSAVRAAAPASDVKLPTAESGILREGGSSVVLGGSSVVGGAKKADSDLAMDDDSSLVMDNSSLVLDDSGLAIEGGKPDSGITLESGKPDSGITLGGVDSGITLGGPDSGLMLAGDSGFAVASNAPTVPDDDRPPRLADDADRTQTLDLADDSSDDSTFDINLDDADATRELHMDDDDADETSATVVRKGRPPKGALSAAFELDEGAEVEDLEISEDLDADLEESIEELDGEDEEVFDASDESFSGDDVEATGEEEEDYLEAAETAAKKKPTGPREPAWGMDMTIGLIACMLFLVANTLILWGGVSTMWSGADIEGPAGSLVQTFADIIK